MPTQVFFKDLAITYAGVFQGFSNNLENLPLLF